MGDATIEARDNVVLASFSEDSNAYEALTELKQLDSQGQINLRAAALVVRHSDGSLELKDEVADSNLEGTATGGIVGLLVGLLFGPFGVLIGGLTGLLIGSLYDLDDEDETGSVLSDISRGIPVGHVTLLAEVTEPSPDVIDAAVSRLGGQTLRRPVADVEAEIAAAEQAQKAAKKEARKVLREQRANKAKADVHAKVEELKAKLHHQSTTATTSA
jgi:uncharacterized membrane protein